MGKKLTEVGGTPVFFYAAYTDPGSAAVEISLPRGFLPDYIVVLTNVATNGRRCEWFRNGNANPGGLITDNSTGIVTLMTTNGITVTAESEAIVDGKATFTHGKITLGTDVVDDNITGAVMAWRYTQ